MERMRVAALPLVDGGQLQGIVEKTRLMSSLLVEVATKLES